MTKILVTRPKDQSHGFVSGLTECGIPVDDIICDPVLRIEQSDVKINLDAYSGVILTSVHAVPDNGLGRLAYCVGEQTALVAENCGFKVAATSPTAAGLRVVLTRKKLPDLAYLRGRYVTDDFDDIAHGVVVYDQIPTALNMATLDVIQRGTPLILPLFSRRSAMIVKTELGSFKGHCVVAISEKTAQIASDTAKHVIVAEKPDLQAMIRATHRLWLGGDLVCSHPQD